MYSLYFGLGQYLLLDLFIDLNLFERAPWFLVLLSFLKYKKEFWLAFLPKDNLFANIRCCPVIVD